VRGFRILLCPECKRQGERVPDPLVSRMQAAG
jgi:hypothetical protein